jgi:hypothetical protein
MDSTKLLHLTLGGVFPICFFGVCTYYYLPTYLPTYLSTYRWLERFVIYVNWSTTHLLSWAGRRRRVSRRKKRICEHFATLSTLTQKPKEYQLGEEGDGGEGGGGICVGFKLNQYVKPIWKLWNMWQSSSFCEDHTRSKNNNNNKSISF